MIEPALHCSRTPTTPEDAASQIPRAREIAEPILDAFGLTYSLLNEEEDLIYRLGTARDLPQPQGNHSARREMGPDELVLPGYAGNGSSLFAGSWGPTRRSDAPRRWRSPAPGNRPAWLCTNSPDCT